MPFQFQPNVTVEAHGPSGMVWPGASAPSLKSPHPSHRVLSWCILSLAYIGNIFFTRGSSPSREPIVLHTRARGAVPLIGTILLHTGEEQSHRLWPALYTRSCPALYWGKIPIMTPAMYLPCSFHTHGGRGPSLCLAGIWRQDLSLTGNAELPSLGHPAEDLALLW